MRASVLSPSVPKTGSVRGDAPAIAVENLSFAYGEKPILDNISFSVPPGTICGLFGPNGSGKTTLFRCCIGLQAPRGNIRVNGLDAAELSISERARHMAYVPQEHKPGFPFLVREIVAMGRTPHLGAFAFSRLSPHDKEMVHLAMHAAGVEELADEPCTALSGGQRQLAYLARAIAQGAPLMLLDEPTSALDFSNQMLVWQTLRRITRTGVTAVVCCHDPNHILWFCDEVAVLHQGALLASGPSEATLSESVLRTLYGTSLEIRTVDGKPFVRPPVGERDASGGLGGKASTEPPAAGG